MNDRGKTTWQLICLSGLMVLISAVTGCGGPSVKSMVAEDNEMNLEKVRTCYLLYAARNQSSGPKSEEELKEFLRTSDTIDANLKLLEIDRNSIDELFVSQRDGQPFVFRWGLSISSGSQTAVVFETTGVDGKRMVAFSDGSSRETDESEYDELLGKKPRKK